MHSSFVVLLPFFSILHESSCSPAELSLITKLMSTYNSLERPTANESWPVTIVLSMTLQQLITLDEQRQTLVVNAWLKYTWHDSNLFWNPADYEDIQDIRFPPSMLWKPDVLLYNSVDSKFDSTFPVNMVVRHDGWISWIPPGIFQLSCKIDITFFPFDEQLCFLKFGSWTYDGTRIDLQPDPVLMPSGYDMTEYMDNGEFFLAEKWVERTVKYYECCPEPYPDLKFYLRLRRRTLYYTTNLILPCFITVFMTVMGFVLPSDACEKITLQITVMLSVCVFLNIVAELTPPTSEAVPLLGVFFSTCLTVVAASVMFTVCVLNLHFRSAATHEMSTACRTILLHYAPWFFRIGRPGHR